MLMIISPAKTLDFSNKNQELRLNRPRFLQYSKILIDELKKNSPDDISRLMKINLSLAEMNHTRYLQWTKEISDIDKHAVLAFKGEVYRGLSAGDMSVDQLEFADKHLRILSGLYGILKPLDGIKPYRLEMGIKLKHDEHKNLYSFWGDKIAEDINGDLDKHTQKFLINLASEEYYKAVKEYIKHPVINITFKDRKRGVYKIIPIYAKRARGLMARYVIENKIDTVDGLKEFEMEDYIYADYMSSEKNLVFLRG
ncbi:peroxide stress protein YaaA [Clostridium fungisolvens]|uniref:UPF0246 protein bsdtw1_03407 n=1 Tax=Clostridium fungisolvens TaxID=1604897 RepID=A0A6V8SL64_9CLOT|nr:peroxide stress protein YaaA [Clostridium fungisolvens]GFP77292.1 Peroxide stress resistance protein YaaA [Clostridium fungisolvens]